MDTFANNPYLFYRLGLCCIERELQDAKINSQSENVNDIVNKIINDPSENENSSRAKRILLVNSSVNGNSDEDANKNITEAINSTFSPENSPLKPLPKTHLRNTNTKMITQ